MSLLTHTHFHYFFQKKDLNLSYLAVVMMAFAESMVHIFIPIYLYTLHYPIQSIILFYFLISLNFLLFAYPGARVVSKVGVRNSFIFSTFFLITVYIGMNSLVATPWLFLALPTLFAWRMILYNYAYHLNFVVHSETESKKMSAAGILSIILHVIAPMIGGFLAFIGFSYVFNAGSILLFLGAIPFFFTEDKHEDLTFTQKDLVREIHSQEKGRIFSFSGYAVESVIGKIVWPVYLIVIIVSLKKTGMIVAGSMILSVFVFYITKYIAETYDRMRMLRFGTVLYFFAWVGRIFADSSYKILLIDSYKHSSERVVHIPWFAHGYDVSVKKGYFRFIVARELIFNISRLIVMPFLMLIFIIDIFPFVVNFIIAALFSIGYVFMTKK